MLYEMIFERLNVHIKSVYKRTSQKRAPCNIKNIGMTNGAREKTLTLCKSGNGAGNSPRVE